MSPSRRLGVRSEGLQRRRPGERLCALLLTVVVLVCTAPAAAGAGAPGLDPDVDDRRTGPVVLVGVPGLLWEDVTPEHTPALWDLAGAGAIGNVSIRTATSRTCPTDGWLSISAGQRALSERERFTVCEPAPEPV